MLEKRCYGAMMFSDPEGIEDFGRSFGIVGSCEGREACQASRFTIYRSAFLKVRIKY